MSKGRLIGGIICLAAAVLLAVLNSVLPADQIMFMVNGANAPMIPVAVLAIVGLGLLVSARKW